MAPEAPLELDYRAEAFQGIRPPLLASAAKLERGEGGFFYQSSQPPSSRNPHFQQAM